MLSVLFIDIVNMCLSLPGPSLLTMHAANTTLTFVNQTNKPAVKVLRPDGFYQH